MARPRKLSLPPKEMIQLGKEMVKWVKEHEKVLHLSEWYTIEKGYTYNEWKRMLNCSEFVPYYEKALKIIAKKYIDGTIHPSIAQRFLRIYFNDLREHEDATKKYESELKQKEQSTELVNLEEIKEKIASGEISQK